jgi:hypothetical protein
MYISDKSRTNSQSTDLMKLTKKQLKILDILVDHLTKVTVRISTWNEKGELTGSCSGFLYQREPNTIPLVITAGHKLPELGSFIETRIRKDGKPLLINAGKFNVFYNHNDIDYAYSILPVKMYMKEMKAYEDIEFIIYNHKFIKAKPNEGYGFAVINNFEFVKSGDNLILPLYCCHELFLELVDQDEHINYFKIARKFQGHEYYKGASGSPITDEEGAITSILIGGDEDTGVLRAFRLDNIEFETSECLNPSV